MEQVYIKPFAVFQVRDKAFVMRTRTLYADEITQAQYEWLASIQGQYTLEVAPGQLACLESLRLLSDTPISAESEMERDTAIWKKAKAGIVVSTIELMVAQACNMRCEYCYGSDGSYHNPGIMEEKTAFEALDFLRREVDKNDKVREVTVVFLGGEPLLNYDLIVRCVERAEALFADKTLNFGMTTNLTLMTEERLDFFASHRFNVLISFDGPREYQARRIMQDGSDSYDITVELIGKALARLGRVAARATIYKEDDRDRIIAEYERLGFREYQLCGVSGNLGEGVVRDDLFFDQQEQEARLSAGVARYAELLVQRDEEGMRAQVRDKELRQLLMEAIRGHRIMSRRMMACGNGRAMLAVSRDGEFYPCHRFVGQPEHRMGSLAEGLSPGEYESNILLRNPTCAGCMARYICGGPCAHICACDVKAKPGLPGIFNIPESHCSLMRTRLMLKVYVEAITGDADKAWIKELALL